MAAQKALERGRAVKAVELAKQCTDMDPTHAYAWLLMGAAYQELGKRDLAREAFNACVQKGKGRGRNECRQMGGR